MNDYGLPDADDRALAELYAEEEAWLRDAVAQQEYQQHLDQLNSQPKDSDHGTLRAGLRRR